MPTSASNTPRLITAAFTALLALGLTGVASAQTERAPSPSAEASVSPTAAEAPVEEAPAEPTEEVRDPAEVAPDARDLGDDALIVEDAGSDALDVQLERVEAHDFAAMDVNETGSISPIELRRGIAPLFQRWDTDADDRLDTNELTRGVYDRWDRDQDGALHVEEFKTGRMSWMSAAIETSFADFDANDDGVVTIQEFRAASSRLPVAWRADAPLRAPEFVDVLIIGCDRNGDRLLSQDEFAATA